MAARQPPLEPSYTLALRLHLKVSVSRVRILSFMSASAASSLRRKMPR